MIQIYSNEIDRVVAHSVEEAWLLWERHTGDDRIGYEFDWTVCDPAEIISMWCSSDDEPFPIPTEYLKKAGQHENMYSATTAEWLTLMQAAGFSGFWISSEW